MSRLSSQPPRQDSTMLPMSPVNTIAYTMSCPNVSHHFDKREPMPVDRQLDEESAARTQQSQQGSYNYYESLPFLRQDGLEYQ
jgi:hypothetical protein